MSVASQQIYEFLGVAAVFSSDAMDRVLTLAERVARSNAAVLITGESGSGKEVIARAIHHFSPRCAQSWVDLNCAALPDNLLERELFDRGAMVTVTTGVDANGLELMKAAGLLVIVPGEPPADFIDARRLATHEAIAILERRGVLTGHEEQLLHGEGI